MPSLLGHIFIHRTLPGKRQLLNGVGNYVKDLATHPINTIKKGIENDRLAVEQYKIHTGKTRMAAARNLAKNVGSGVYRGGGKDLLVNTGGAVGSTVGSPGGIAGELAGDWAGAAVTRKGLDNAEGIIKANKIIKNPRFQQQPTQIQKQILRKRQQGFSRSIAKGYGKELKQDTVGWAVGNGANKSLRAVGSRVPLQGGGIAMATVPSIMKGAKVGSRVARRTGSRITGIKTGLTSTKRGIVKAVNPVRQVKKGVAREKRMVGSVNSQLQKLPALPPGTNFRRNIYLLSHFNLNSV